MDASFHDVIERGMFSHQTDFQPTSHRNISVFHHSPLSRSKTGLWFTAWRRTNKRWKSAPRAVYRMLFLRFILWKTMIVRVSRHVEIKNDRTNIYSARFNLIRAGIGLKILFPPFPAFADGTPRWRKNALREEWSRERIERLIGRACVGRGYVSRSVEPISF